MPSTTSSIDQTKRGSQDYVACCVDGNTPDAVAKSTGRASGSNVRQNFESFWRTNGPAILAGATWQQGGDVPQPSYYVNGMPAVGNTGGDKPASTGTPTLTDTVLMEAGEAVEDGLGAFAVMAVRREQSIGAPLAKALDAITKAALTLQTAITASETDRKRSAATWLKVETLGLTRDQLAAKLPEGVSLPDTSDAVTKATEALAKLADFLPADEKPADEKPADEKPADQPAS